MDQKQQYDPRTDQDPYKDDLWNDYMDSLEEEPKQAEESGSRLSDQVDEDLYNYSRDPYVRRYKKKKSPIVIAGICGAIGVAALAGLLAFTAVHEYRQQQYYENIIEYDDDYEDAYSYLGRDYHVPEFVFNDHYYQLPVKYSEFDLSYMSIRKDAFEDPVTEVGSEPVQLTVINDWGEEEITLTVVSPTGETVPLQDAEIIGISSSSGRIEITDYTGRYSTFSYVQDELMDQGFEINGHSYNGISEYHVSTQAPSDSNYQYYNLSFQVEGDEITSIAMLLSDEDLR